MALDKTKVIIWVFIFAILSVLLLNFFGINMDDNTGFRVLQRKAVYEGLANKASKKAQKIE